jgi:DNA alkylation repair enzyme
MKTVQSVMEELRACGKESYLKTFIRHGIPADRTFGVPNPDLKSIAKSIKGQQDLALELFATGNMDAMYLAGIVVDGAKMTRVQLQAWAGGSHGMTVIANYPVAWAAIENKDGWEVALEWIQSDDAMIQCSGWSTLSGIVTVTPDDQLNLNKVSELLVFVQQEIHGAQNRPKSAMNTFVITVGCYVLPLHMKAKEIAMAIGVVTLDHGDTDCKTKTASEAIEKFESSGKLGMKRKTVRC